MNDNNRLFNIKCQDNEDDSNLVVEVNYSDILPEKPNLEYGFNERLNNQRNRIDQIDANTWKKIRWYVNDYDFLVKEPIINRAFYKYWEIINEFNIFDKFTESDVIVHCAEAPGGFIQGSNIYMRFVEQKNKKVEKDEDGFTEIKKKKPKKEYKIYSISLNKDLPKYRMYNLPSYNKCILKKHVCITYGKDNTGDINNVENVEYIRDLLPNKECFLVTSDGGFDEGNEFNNKEQLHYYLILNEIYASIVLQKTGGNFILKVFDIFTNTSINLLYLLNCVYDTVYIYKPNTSRPTNSEKYVICKGFKELNDKANILDKLKKLSERLKEKDMKYSSFTLFKSIPDVFIEKIKNMNTLLLNRQCYYLNKAIELCDDSKFINNYDNELDSSLEKRKSVYNKWEKKYKLDCYFN